jgi:aminoglycoside phosphotransferase (APT) family kinase protein
MEYLHTLGYPVPAVDEVSEDGTELVMERIHGPSMVDAIAHSPWTITRHGRMLADLHQRLHELPPPEFLAHSELGGGDSILHLDLHPLNVVIGPAGPVVIDWTNARIGNADIDVALAWVLMSAGEIPGNRTMAKVLGLGRSFLVRSFLSGFDRERVTAVAAGVVEWKQKDQNMTPGELERMRSVVKRAQSRSR